MAKRGRPYQGGDNNRVQIRAGSQRQRKGWQTLADQYLGQPGAPLGPFLRAMIDAGIRATWPDLAAQVDKAVRR